MRAGKKESIGVLIGAMAEAESKSFYDDTEAVTSDLKSLLKHLFKKGQFFGTCADFERL